MMRERADLLNDQCLTGLEVFQLTTEQIPSSHIYMEAQIFTPDSKRLIVHRSAHPHGSDPKDPAHQYLICDLEQGGELRPITTELGATAPSIAPAGDVLFYFTNETEPAQGGKLTLKRVNLDGTQREQICVVDSVLPGAPGPFSRPYPLSTVSSDGQRVAISGFLGDGSAADAPWGLLVFDVPSGRVELILQGSTWCNVHPQYCRSKESSASHDLLVQENHGNECDASGAVYEVDRR